MNHATSSRPATLVPGILCGAGAGALWGLVFLAPELIRTFSPLHLTIGRYAFFGLMSAALLARRWQRVRAALTRQQWIGVTTLALVGHVLYYLLLSSAVQLGGIAMTSLIIGFLPIAVTLIGSRDANAVPLKKLLPSILCCAGGALCIGWQAVALPSAGSVGQQVAGLACALGALVAWTWFAVANSRWLARLEHVTVHDWNLLTGVMTGVLTIAVLPALWLLGPSEHSATDWLQLASVSAGLAFLASIVGNTLWNRMSRLLPLTLVGQMILFETLFALTYGFVWEQRLPTAFEAAAFVLVALGVMTCVAAHRKPTRANSPPSPLPQTCCETTDAPGRVDRVRASTD